MTALASPSPNGSNRSGRAPGGRFAPGNSGGPGNPHAAAVGRLRAAMLAAVSPEDVAAIVRQLVELAKGGSVPAIREVLDRTVGKPVEVDLIERLECLEALMERREPG
jgi:hypothetical protein